MTTLETLNRLVDEQIVRYGPSTVTLQTPLTHRHHSPPQTIFKVENDELVVQYHEPDISEDTLEYLASIANYWFHRLHGQEKMANMH